MYAEPEERKRARILAQAEVTREMGDGATKPWMKPLARDLDADHHLDRDEVGRLTQEELFRRVMHRDHEREPGQHDVMSIEDSRIHQELVKTYIAEYYKRWNVKNVKQQPNSVFRSAVAEMRAAQRA